MKVQDVPLKRFILGCAWSNTGLVIVNLGLLWIDNHRKTACNLPRIVPGRAVSDSVAVSIFLLVAVTVFVLRFDKRHRTQLEYREGLARRGYDREGAATLLKIVFSTSLVVQVCLLVRAAQRVLGCNP